MSCSGLISRTKLGSTVTGSTPGTAATSSGLPSGPAWGPVMTGPRPSARLVQQVGGEQSVFLRRRRSGV
ncbi:MAG: hypothetical protein R2851_06760 [Caldilineaceae bacterium]